MWIVFIVVGVFGKTRWGVGVPMSNERMKDFLKRRKNIYSFTIVYLLENVSKMYQTSKSSVTKRLPFLLFEDSLRFFRYSRHIIQFTSPDEVLLERFKGPWTWLHALQSFQFTLQWMPKRCVTETSVLSQKWKDSYPYFVLLTKHYAELERRIITYILFLD